MALVLPKSRHELEHKTVLATVDGVAPGLGSTERTDDGGMALAGLRFDYDPLQPSRGTVASLRAPP
ncbi:hypothetical protein [Nitrospira sp. Nam74]